MTDRYLKGVLTVIAFALCWIAVQLTVRDVSAAPGDPVPVLTTGQAHQLRNSSRAAEVLVVPVYCVNCASTGIK